MAKASEWTRTTAALDPANLDSDLLAAITATAERERLETDPRAASYAIITASERTTRRLLSSRTERTDTAMLLGERLLTVAVRPAEGPVVVSFLPLEGLEVRPFESTLVDDVGLEVIGVAVGATERASRFLAMDDGTAGRTFRLELDRAIAAA